MSASFQVFEPAYTFINGKLDTFLNDDASNVIAQVSGPMRAALMLYVVLYGFAILRGAIAEPIVDFAIRSLKLALITMLAGTTAYSTWITTPLFTTLPNTLAQALGSSATTDPGASFDQFFGRAAYLGEKISQQGNLANPMPWIEAVAVDVVGGLAAAIGFGVVLVAKVSLALLIALGPAFVACSLFDASRRFFFGWLSQAVNYLVLMALIFAVLQMILSLVSQEWSTIDGADALAGGLMFIALSILGAIFFLQTPTIAAGIAGGASVGLADFGAAVGIAVKSPRSAAYRTQGGSTQLLRTGGSFRTFGARPLNMSRILVSLALILPTLIAFASCATSPDLKPAVCDGKHRRPANPHGSVLAAPPAEPPMAPASAAAPTLKPQSLSRLDPRSYLPCGDRA